MPAKKAAAKKIVATKSVAPAKKVAVKKPALVEPSAPAPVKVAAKAAKKAAKKAATKGAAVKSVVKKSAAELSEGMRLAVAAACFAEDIKAEQIVVLDVSEVSSITDFFVICSGTSTPHLKAIAREVRAGMSEAHAVKPSMADGDHESQWVVLDYGIMMVHAFHPEKRDLYALEDLWGDAKMIDWQALAEK
jgi:ribosome-associated protein